jgi:hypothetical protein
MRASSRSLPAGRRPSSTQLRAANVTIQFILCGKSVLRTRCQCAYAVAVIHSIILWSFEFAQYEKLYTSCSLLHVPAPSSFHKEVAFGVRVVS